MMVRSSKGREERGASEPHDVRADFIPVKKTTLRYCGLRYFHMRCFAYSEAARTQERASSICLVPNTRYSSRCDRIDLAETLDDRERLVENDVEDDALLLFDSLVRSVEITFSQRAVTLPCRRRGLLYG
jgi:hypothetical protein